MSSKKTKAKKSSKGYVDTDILSSDEEDENEIKKNDNTKKIKKLIKKLKSTKDMDERQKIEEDIEALKKEDDERRDQIIKALNEKKETEKKEKLDIDIKERDFLLNYKDIIEDKNGEHQTVLKEFINFINSDEDLKKKFNNNNPSFDYIKEKIKQYKKYKLEDTEETKEKNFLTAYKYEKDPYILLTKFREFIDNDSALKVKFRARPITVQTIKLLINKYFKDENQEESENLNKLIITFFKKIKNSSNIKKELFNFENENPDKLLPNFSNAIDRVIKSGIANNNLKSLINDFLEQDDLLFSDFVNTYLNKYTINIEDIEEEKQNTILLNKLKEILKNIDYDGDIFEEIHAIVFDEYDNKLVQKIYKELNVEDSFYLFKKIINEYLSQDEVSYIYNPITRTYETEKHELKTLEDLYNEFLNSSTVKNYERRIMIEKEREKEQEERKLMEGEEKDQLNELKKERIERIIMGFEEKESREMEGRRNITPGRKERFHKFYNEQKAENKKNKEIKDILNGTITHVCEIRGKKDLSDHLSKIGRDIEEYKFNSSYMNELISIIKTNSENAEEFMKRIANIIYYSSSDLTKLLNVASKKINIKINNTSFISNIKNFFYITPNDLFQLTNDDSINEKLPNIFYNESISNSIKKQILNKINSEIKKVIKLFAINIYNELNLVESEKQSFIDDEILKKQLETTITFLNNDEDVYYKLTYDVNKAAYIRNENLTEEDDEVQKKFLENFEGEYTSFNKNFSISNQKSNLVNKIRELKSKIYDLKEELINDDTNDSEDNTNDSEDDIKKGGDDIKKNQDKLRTKIEKYENELESLLENQNKEKEEYNKQMNKYDNFLMPIISSFKNFVDSDENLKKKYSDKGENFINKTYIQFLFAKYFNPAFKQTWLSNTIPFTVVLKLNTQELFNNIDNPSYLKYVYTDRYGDKIYVKYDEDFIKQFKKLYSKKLEYKLKKLRDTEEEERKKDLAPDFFELLNNELDQLEKGMFEGTTYIEEPRKQKEELKEMAEEDINVVLKPSIIEDEQQEDKVVDEEYDDFEYNPTSDTEEVERKSYDYIAFYYDTYKISKGTKKLYSHTLTNLEDIKLSETQKQFINKERKNVERIAGSNNNRIESLRDQLRKLRKMYSHPMTYSLQHNYESPDSIVKFYEIIKNNKLYLETANRHLENLQMLKEDKYDFDEEKIKNLDTQIQKSIQNINKYKDIIKENETKLNKFPKSQVEKDTKLYENIMKELNSKNYMYVDEILIKKLRSFDIGQNLENDQITYSLMIKNDFIKNETDSYIFNGLNNLIFEDEDRQKKIQESGVAISRLLYKIYSEAEVLSQLLSILEVQDYIEQNKQLNKFLYPIIEDMKKDIILEFEYFPKYFVIFRKDPFYISCIYDIKNQIFQDKDDATGILDQNVLQNPDKDYKSQLFEYLEINKNDNIYANIFLQKKRFKQCNYDGIEKYINLINSSEKIKEKDRIGAISMDKYIDNTDDSSTDRTHPAFINIKFGENNIPYFVYRGKEYIKDSNDSGDDDDSLSGYSIESENENDKSLNKDDDLDLSSDSDLDLSSGSDSDLDLSSGSDSDLDLSSGSDSDLDLSSGSDNELNKTKNVGEQIFCINCKKNITTKDKVFKSYIVKNKKEKELIHFCNIKCFEKFEDWPPLK
jgi:hypothetical protein